MTAFARSCFMPMCRLVSRRTHSPLHHFFLTLDPAAHGGTTHLTIFSLVRPRLMTTCVFLGAFPIPALPTLLLTSLHLDLLLASSSATPLTPRDIGAMIPSPTVSSLPGTFTLMSMCFRFTRYPRPFLPPPVTRASRRLSVFHLLTSFRFDNFLKSQN